MGWFSGTPEKRENVSLLRPGQEGLYKQLVRAGKKGKGGAFGQAADYYRNLLSDESQDYNAFAAPALRQYNEEIIPGLSEQFAGMGSGGLSSSGFRNAQIQGATDLAERLGALRANLRQSGAQGLANIGQMGLNPFSQNMVTKPGTKGFAATVAPAIGKAAATFVGPFGNAASNWLFGEKPTEQASPYGANGPQASPTGFGTGNGFNLPSFGQGYGNRWGG